jgi:hypothetical protein
MSARRPGTAATATRRQPTSTGERRHRVQLDQPAAVTRLLLANPERRPHDHPRCHSGLPPLLTRSGGAIANVLYEASV